MNSWTSKQTSVVALFCDTCNSILNESDTPDSLKCLHCGSTGLHSIVSQSVVLPEHEVTNERRRQRIDHVEEQKRATVDEACLECGNTVMYFYTLQLRSVDEGSTGNLEGVLSLISKGVDLNSRGGLENTPLHWAAGAGHRDVVRALLRSGDNRNMVNALNERQETPLHLAVARNHRETVDLLLEFGSSTTLLNHELKSPLDLASSSELRRVLSEESGVSIVVYASSDDEDDGSEN